MSRPRQAAARALLAALVLATAACGESSCGRPSAAGAVVEVGHVEVALTARGEGGEPFDLGADGGALVREALGRATVLGLAEGRAPGRLRVTADLSRDGATGELHTRVEGRVDRAGSAPLEWEVLRVRPAPDRGSAGDDARTYRESLAAAIGELVAALDSQAALAGRSDEELVAALGSGDAAASTAAARALGARRSRSAVSPLCRSLDRGPAALSEASAQALAAIGDGAAAPCLARWGEADPSRLELVVEALGMLRGEEAREALSAIAEGNGPATVRHAAARYLGAGSARDAGPRHDHGEEELSPRVRGLVKALSDPEDRVRRGAARALAETRSPQAIEPLCDMLEGQDGEDSLAALDALASMRDPGAIPCMLRWGSDDGRRLAVVVPALVIVGGPEARGVLEMLSREGDDDAIRELATAGLADLDRRGGSR